MSAMCRSAKGGSRRGGADESLFGGSARSSARAGGFLPKLASSHGASCSARAAAAVAPVVLTRSEVDRIRRAAQIKTDEDIRREKADHERQQEERNQKANERKKRMIEMEEERRKVERPSTAEQEKRERNQKILQNAQRYEEESQDAVKRMNQIAEYAKAVAVRNSQQQERESQLAYEKKLEEQLELQLEIDRLKKYEELQAIEEERRRRAIEDARQMALQREANRTRGEKAKASTKREELEIVSRFRKEEEDHRNELARKREEKKELLLLTLAENEENKRIKRKQREEELEYDHHILAYQLEKDREAEEKLQEEKRKRDEREKEIVRLRMQQEKFSDQKAALDALRAKRAMEASERQARQKDLDDLRKREGQAKELNEYYVIQRQAKERQREMHKKEMHHVIETERQLALDSMQTEVEHEQSKKASNLRHQEQLRDQIREREEQQMKAKYDTIHSIEGIKQEHQEYLDGLERVKAQKLAELRALGIEEKYLVELEHYNPEKVFVQDYKMGGKTHALCDR